VCLTLGPCILPVKELPVPDVRSWRDQSGPSALCRLLSPMQEAFFWLRIVPVGLLAVMNLRFLQHKGLVMVGHTSHGSSCATVSHTVFCLRVPEVRFTFWQRRE
jgi:hypothetical protein